MRIAHLTDLHVLERDAATRRGSDRIRLELLCNGRRLDPDDRKSRVLRALDSARRSGADHLVITGDLTEDGSLAQFEMLAEIFDEANVDPSRTTLVAGNHDAYCGADVWVRALSGPLAAFRPTSTASTVVDLGPLTVLPVCTRMEQPWIRAAGVVGSEARHALDRSLRDPSIAARPAIVAMHHPLVARSVQAYHWFDGLIDQVEVTTVLGRHKNATVLHGHDHRKMDLPIGNEVRIRSRGAYAVVEHPSPMRIYDIEDGRFIVDGESVGAGIAGAAFAPS